MCIYNNIYNNFWAILKYIWWTNNKRGFNNLLGGKLKEHVLAFKESCIVWIGYYPDLDSGSYWVETAEWRVNSLNDNTTHVREVGETAKPSNLSKS